MGDPKAKPSRGLLVMKAGNSARVVAPAWTIRLKSLQKASGPWKRTGNK